MSMSKEKLSNIGWEKVRNLYREPIQRAMFALYTDLKENMPESNPSEPFEMDCDDYSVCILCSPEGRERFDISFRLDDSQDFEGMNGGYTFSIHIVEEGGLILGGFSPYNYTEQVWCTTLKAIKERYELVENSLDTITAFLAEEVL